MQTEFYERIKEQIANVKAERGFTSIEQIADDIGRFCAANDIDGSVSKQALHSFTQENGNKPTYGSMYILCKYFDVSSDYLVGLSHTPSTDENVKTAVRVLSVEDEKTINAIKDIFEVLSATSDHQDFSPEFPNYLRGKELQPLIEKIIQTDSFRNMFGGYEDFIVHSIKQYFDKQCFKPTESKPRFVKTIAYETHSAITLNAYKAAEDIEKIIHEYCKRLKIPRNLMKGAKP